MNKNLILLGIMFLSAIGFSQAEEFLVTYYTLDNREMLEFEPETNAGTYANFGIYRNEPYFLLGVERDSSYSYGYIENVEQEDLELIDSASVVTYNSYKWYYANSYNFKTGVAKIETVRIYYKTRMSIIITINVEAKSSKDKSSTIQLVAYNRYY